MVGFNSLEWQKYLFRFRSLYSTSQSIFYCTNKVYLHANETWIRCNFVFDGLILCIWNTELHSHLHTCATYKSIAKATQKMLNFGFFHFYSALTEMIDEDEGPVLEKKSFSKKPNVNASSKTSWKSQT